MNPQSTPSSFFAADPTTGYRRKIPAVVSGRKINQRFRLSDKVFGFANGTLNSEIQIISEEYLEGFTLTPSDWEALVQRLGPLAGWTNGREDVPFRVTINEN